MKFWIWLLVVTACMVVIVRGLLEIGFFIGSLSCVA